MSTFRIVKPFTIKRTSFFLPLLFIVLIACNSREDVPFPAEETEFAQPVIKPLIVGEPQKIKWITTNPDSVSPPEVTPFDISKAPSKPFDMGGFKPFNSPIKETKFNWSDLPDTAFDIDKLEEKPLVIRTSLMLKPQRIATQLPTSKEGSVSGQLIFGTSQGLPSERIDDIIQDRYGRIWIICHGKLYCYNGDYLEYYPIEDGPALLKVSEDSAGKLWLSTEFGNPLYVLDPKAGVQWKIKNIYVTTFSVAEDNNGLIWVAAYNGFFIIDWNKKTMRGYQTHHENKRGNTFLDILKDHENRMWLAGGDGLYIIDLKNKRMQSISTKQGLIALNQFSLSEDNRGRIWVGHTADSIVNGINVIDPAAGITKYIGTTQGIKHPGFYAIQDDQQNIYIAADSMLYVIDKDLQGFKTMVDNEGYTDYWLAHFIIDKSGRIWKGTRTNGIVILDTKGLMPQQLTSADGLGGEGITSIIQDKKKKIWMGGFQTGISGVGGWINIIDSAGNRISDVSKAIHAPLYAINNLRLDNEGRICGAGSIGLEIFDENKGTITHIGKKQGLNGAAADCSIKDSRGMTWLGTDAGPEVIDSSLQRVSHLTDYMNLNESRIIWIMEDSAKQVWITTVDNGLFMVDSSRSYINHFGSKQGLSSDGIDDIAEISGGWLWIGTEVGVTVLNYKKKEFYTITTAEGLIDVSGYSVEKVGEQIYVGTNSGLSVFTPVKTAEPEKGIPKWKVRSYNKYQGLTYLDFNSNSSLVRNGQIWFGMDWKAMTIVNQQKEDSLALPAYITEMDIQDKPMDFSDHRLIESGIGKGDTVWAGNENYFYLKDRFPKDTGYLQKNNITWDSTDGPYNIPVHLQIPYAQNFVSFHFTSTDFNSRDKIRYRYILEGADKSWGTITGKTFTESYRDLAPGKYTFKVRSRAFNGAWSKPAALSFTILPPWWRTWWAYLLYMLVFGLFVQSIVRYRSRWLKKENKRLEQMVTQRTDELSKSLDELKATQTQLIQSEKMASLGELTAGIAHEIQNPLNFVNNFTEVNTELIDEMRTAIDSGNTDEVKAIANDIKDNNLKISHHGKRADSIVKGMLQHSRSSSNSTKEPTDINLLADEYLRLSYHGLRAKDKSFNATLNTGFDKTIGKINIIPQDIGRVLLNLYNNAFYATNEKSKNQNEKFEPVVTVTTKRPDSPFGAGGVVISVKDNGNGVPQKIVDKIFQPFFTTKPTGQGTGLGLSLSYDIIKAHGGEIKVESKEGEGSEFTIILPAK